MLYSMTGFGSAEFLDNNKHIRVELKTLNSKFTDVKFKFTHSLKEKELELRHKVQNALKRGKADVNISISHFGQDEGYELNGTLIKQYFQLLSEIKDNTPGLSGDYLQSIMRIPSVIVEKEKIIDPKDYPIVDELLQKAIEKLDYFRKEEGQLIANDFNQGVARILALLKEVGTLEEDRIVKVREKFQQALETFAKNITIDKNRMEQEIIYYIERYDVTEEKMRLKKHCDYFIEELSTDKIAKGKKLNFIAQEMGREINTLGAKANSTKIQHIVVNMKDELEKIKEQLGNIV